MIIAGHSDSVIRMHKYLCEGVVGVGIYMWLKCGNQWEVKFH